MLRAIVFDFDGVILDSVDVKARAFRELFRDHGEWVDRIVQFHLDNPGMSRFDKFRFIYQTYLGRSLEDGESDALGQAFSRLVYQEILACPFIRGAPEFLERRRKEYAMFVASAAPDVEVRDIVACRGLAGFFRGVYGSPRAKPDLLRQILVDQGLAPWQAVFIGDAVADQRAAQAVGMPFIAVASKDGQQRFTEPGVLLAIENLRELDERWEEVTARVAPGGRAT